jgi:D-alanine-D-alanine ligase
VRERIAIVYNEPIPSRYDTVGEGKAVNGVLDAVAAVRRSLLELDCKVTCLPLAPPMERVRKTIGSLDVDLVFNLFEGFCGQPETEAMVPEYLEGIGIPFTGCPAAALGLCLDKARVKVLLQAAGIPTPDFQLLSPDTMHMFRLGYPCIVKPRSEDASHGLSEASVVTDSASLKKQVRLISASYGGGAIVEEFINGREFNATVMGNSQCTVLPVSEITYSLPPEMPEILAFSAKWEPDSPYYRGTGVVCPAGISADEQESINYIALAVFRLLGCRGYARVDMRMDKEGRLNVIEVNPNPDISPDAGAVRQAKATGMSYTKFIDKMVRLALEKEDDDSQNSPYAAKRQASPDENITGYARVQAV